jgi:SAM-dependent methyltransferase
MHLDFLASPEWAEMLENELLPWVLAHAQLGDDVLEVGPGPGLTTDILRRHAPQVTAVELDGQLASALAARLEGTNVEVVHGDATDTGLPAGRFSAAACFSMLHHVPSAAVQDRLFAETARVLRPGGVLVGTDSRDLDFIRDFHVDDVFVPVDPATFPARLEAAGLTDVILEETEFEVRFRAVRPTR